jgi:uncharacterized tellurite resistance protein B-like protein
MSEARNSLVNLGGLNPDELVVLAGALREMMKADGVVSDGELKKVASIARRLGIGEREWAGYWDTAIRTLPNLDAVMTRARDLERAEAREALYELLYEIAQDETIVDAEWDILEWLDEAWRSKRPKD